MAADSIIWTSEDLGALEALEEKLHDWDQVTANIDGEGVTFSRIGDSELWNTDVPEEVGTVWGTGDLRHLAPITGLLRRDERWTYCQDEDGNIWGRDGDQMRIVWTVAQGLTAVSFPVKEVLVERGPFQELEIEWGEVL